MADPTLYNKDGSLSWRALACGYVETIDRVTESGEDVQFRLSHNGTTYDVHVGHDRPLAWAPLPDGSQVLLGWAQFNTLTEARRFFRHVSRSRSLIDAFRDCLSAWVWR